MLKVKFILLIAVTVFSASVYADNTTNKTSQNNFNPLQFSIIQESMMLDRNDIESLTIVGDDDNKSLEVKLTKNGAQKLQAITSSHIHQPLQLSWNGTILNIAMIQSAISGDFVIALPQDKMQALVDEFNGATTQH